MRNDILLAKMGPDTSLVVIHRKERVRPNLGLTEKYPGKALPSNQGMPGFVYWPLAELEWAPTNRASEQVAPPQLGMKRCKRSCCGGVLPCYFKVATFCEIKLAAFKPELREYKVDCRCNTKGRGLGNDMSSLPLL